jgi:hypothetical protein
MSPKETFFLVQEEHFFMTTAVAIFAEQETRTEEWPLGESQPVHGRNAKGLKSALCGFPACSRLLTLSEESKACSHSVRLHVHNGDLFTEITPGVTGLFTSPLCTHSVASPPIADHQRCQCPKQDNLSSFAVLHNVVIVIKTHCQ